MRIGNSTSASYKRLHARRALRKKQTIARLCTRLDRLVMRAERFGRNSATRAMLMAGADVVREKLKLLDH